MNNSTPTTTPLPSKHIQNNDRTLLIEDQRKENEIDDIANGDALDSRMKNGEEFVSLMEQEKLERINEEFVILLEASVASKCHTLYRWVNAVELLAELFLKVPTSFHVKALFTFTNKMRIF